MVLLSILSNIDRGRFDPLLVCNNELFAREAKNKGVKAIVTNWPEIMIEKGHIKLQFFSVIKKIFWLKNLIRNKKIDLLVCNSGLCNQTGYYAARLAKVPLITYIHSPYNKRYIYLYRLNKTQATIFVSNAILSAMRKKAAFANSRVIHNGVDVNRFSPVTTKDKSILQDLDIGPNTPVIGQIGSLIPRKGIDLLIQAAKILQKQNIKFHFVLVGSGPQEQMYRDMVKHYGLEDKFTFAGNTDTPENFYQHIFDINVLASRSEAFGITLAEGAACGLPCVGSNVEGIPEVIVDETTGLLFETNNAKNLAGKLQQLLTDPGLRRLLGKNGRRHIIENLSQDKQLSQFLEVIEEFSR